MAGVNEIAESYVTRESLDARLEEWMAELEPYQWREPEKLLPDKACLLIVDMTKPFVDEDRPLASPNAQAILPRIDELANAFRQADSPVIWLVQGHHSVAHDRGSRLAGWWPLPILEGTTDVEMASGLEVKDGEKIIFKRRYSGFYQTDLECTLRNLGVTQLVVCGVLTNVCPFTTAFDAFMRDFCVFYPADSTAAINRELHLSALKSVAGWCGYVMRSSEIIRQLV